MSASSDEDLRPLSSEQLLPTDTVQILGNITRVCRQRIRCVIHIKEILVLSQVALTDIHVLRECLPSKLRREHLIPDNC